MDLYFSCPLTSGRQDQPVFAALVAHLQSLGHRVLSEHLATEGAVAQDEALLPSQVYERDTAWLRDCQAMIAEVSTPAHGVGFEIAYALERGRPLLCLARKGARVSKMIRGIQRPGFSFRTYESQAEAFEWMEAYLQEAERMIW